MDPDVAYRKALRVVVAIVIFAFIPSILPAQKKNNNSGNSSKPAAAPAQKPAAQAPRTGPQHQPAQPQHQSQAGHQGNGTRNGTGAGASHGAGTGNGTGAKTAHENGVTVPPAKQPVTVRNPNGSVTHTNANGSSVTRGGNGKPTSVTTASGAKANYTPAGKVSSIDTPVTDAKNPNHSGDMTISKGAHNQRAIITTRKDGSRLVSTGGHRGFVEHSFTRNGHPYMRRTYVVNGRSYAAVYRGYPYRGVVYYGYVPAYYYGPAYYGWAYDPWAAPMVYGWGWGPGWYGYYGYYFSPYATYGDASLWLTDYILAENLQAAYQAQVDGNGGAPPSADSGDQSGNAGGAAAAQTATVMTPEVKQAIDEEVKAQLAAEKADASGGVQTATTGDQVPAALDPNHRTFIVSAPLQEQLDGGATCTLSAGDVLTRIDNAPDANQNVKVLVTSSQKGDCQSGAQVAVSVQDLQDMHNDFAAKIDAGLQKLADTQGKNGIPAGPTAGGQKNPDGTANADLTAAADLQQQQDDADRTEKEVKQAEAGQGN